VAIFHRNSRGQLYGFPIDIKAFATHTNARTGEPYVYAYPWLAIGRNHWGDFVIWFRGRSFTLIEGAPWDGGDE
jgi:hypothetical protein